MAKAEEGEASGAREASADAGRGGAPPPAPQPPPPRPGAPLSAEEAECRICYNRFDLERHAPKMLGCLHTFCRACLSQLHRRQPRSPTDGEGASWASSSSSPPRSPFLACPVCRALTALPAGRVQNLPVNTGLVEAILLQLRGWEPLLRDLRSQRPLFPKPGASSPPASSSPSSSSSPSPSGAVTFRSLEAGTCLQEPRSVSEEEEEAAQSCTAVCRRKAGCACFLFLALALALLAAAWMEWLTGSLFLAVALLLLFASTVPFLYSFNRTFRSQPRTIFFTRAPAGGSREGALTRGGTLSSSSRPSADGRSRW
nr:E3 ubiquitin-protein ligase RNF186 [Anolis sagrei ordinatus]